MKVILALLSAIFAAQCAEKPVVLVITADTENYLLAAGGTIGSMVERGAMAHVIRVTNDDRNSWDLTAEETAQRARAESEQAAKLLGVTEVISLGCRAAETADVPFTTLRDRLMIYIRHYRPTVMFIPDPYAEYDRVLDRYYVGRAAEDAWRAAAFENYIPPFGHAGLKPHVTPELYYYAQPLDPRRRQAESTSTFAPQPKTIDISGTFDKKLKAVQALRTANHSMVMRLKARLDATHRKLPLLDTVDERSISRLVEENVRGLGKIEEFQYAGLEYQIPAKYR